MKKQDIVNILTDSIKEAVEKVIELAKEDDLAKKETPDIFFLAFEDSAPSLLISPYEDREGHAEDEFDIHITWDEFADEILRTVENDELPALVDKLESMLARVKEMAANPSRSMMKCPQCGSDSEELVRVGDLMLGRCCRSKKI